MGPLGLHGLLLSTVVPDAQTGGRPLARLLVGGGVGGGAELAKEVPTLTVTAVPTPRQMETCHVESEEPGAGPVLTMFLQGAEGHSASLCPPYLPTGRGGRNEVGEGGSNILKRNLF